MKLMVIYIFPFIKKTKKPTAHILNLYSSVALRVSKYNVWVKAEFISNTLVSFIDSEVLLLRPKLVLFNMSLKLDHA